RRAADLVPRDAGRARSGHRVPVAVEDVQHDRLAHRVRRGQRGAGARARQGEDQHRLGRVRGGAGGGGGGAVVVAGAGREDARHVQGAPRSLVRRAPARGLRGAGAEGDVLRARRLPQGRVVDGVRVAPARRGRGGDAGHGLRRVRRGLRAADAVRGQGAAGRSGGAGPTRARLAGALALALGACSHPPPPSINGGGAATPPAVVRANPTTPPPAGPVHDIVIRGGTVYDGTGAAPFGGDVCIDGDAIADVAPFCVGKAIVETRGMAVAPGFVNM